MSHRKYPPDPEKQNKMRAKVGAEIMNYFAVNHGETYKTKTAEEARSLAEQNLSDFLADLGHYCDRKGLDLGDCVRRAKNHYNEETDNHGPQFAYIHAEGENLRP